MDREEEHCSSHSTLLSKEYIEYFTCHLVTVALLTSSFVKLTLMLAKLLANCSLVLAPSTTEVTVGCASNQAMATCATVASVE